MSFKEIIGQEGAVTLLKKSFRMRRLAHAYVFIGPEGVGKKKTALNFVKLLTCENVQESVEPCETCPSCLKVSAFNHPDLQWVYPDGQFIKIDAIREATRKLNLKGFESSFKALIISEAQALNEESSNALLKTLEEPSADTVIILIAPSLKNILPTIASRCQRVIFSSLDVATLDKTLRDNFGVAKDEAEYLSRISAGSLGMALRFRDNGLFLRKNKIVEDMFDETVKADNFIGASKHDRIEKREAIEEALAVLSSWLRDMFVAKAGGGRQNYINTDKRDDIMRFAEKFELVDIENRISAVGETLQEVRHNINPRISLTKLKMSLR